MRKCYIFGSAEISDYGSIKVEADSFVIAADGGYRHTIRLGLLPDLLIGDFDSLEGEPPLRCETITAPKEKDDTDMLLAVKAAMGRGFYDITLCGASGGRFDHTIANLQVLEYILSKGGKGRIIEPSFEAYVLSKGSFDFPGNSGYLSMFAISEEAVVTTCGTKYNVENYKLTRSFPVGVSNEMTAASCNITIHHGTLLIILQNNS
ncbi:MAG: thiamine diphosphokinase [Oscillospiraceae bacterium]|nr:thiamine diphosphokinase [Oscillospiraceae bacterium]